MNEKKQLDFLDVLSLIYFALQIKTVENTFTIEDIQKDNDRIMQELHKHMEEQDKKINEIWGVLHNGKI